MNILPKKRWHVRTRENIARVRRDEAAAAEEEKKKQQKVLLAEKEAKRDLLRAQARSRFPGAKPEAAKDEDPVETKAPDESVSLIGTNGHVNLFYELEQTDVVSDRKNEEHEKEAKAEREKEEMKIGYLTYLGQDTNELTGQVSWYNLPRRRPAGSPPTPVTAPATKPPSPPPPEATKPTEHIYQSILPQSKSKKEKKKKKSKKRKKERKILRLAKKIMKKREKRSKKHRRRSGSSSSSSSSESGDEWVAKEDLKVVEAPRKTTDEDIEKMRAERLKREQVERARAAMLLAKLRGEDTRTTPEPASPPPYTAKYNSQFNPELARQNYPAQ